MSLRRHHDYFCIPPVCIHLSVEQQRAEMRLFFSLDFIAEYTHTHTYTCGKKKTKKEKTQNELLYVHIY